MENQKAWVIMLWYRERYWPNPDRKYEISHLASDNVYLNEETAHTKARTMCEKSAARFNSCSVMVQKDLCDNKDYYSYHGFLKDEGGTVKIDAIYRVKPMKLCDDLSTEEES